MAKRRASQLERERRQMRQLAAKLDRRGARFSAMLADPHRLDPQALAREAAALRQLAADLSRQCQKVNRLQSAQETEN